MTEIAMIEGTITECFAYGIGRIDNLGAVSRIVLYAPIKFDGGCHNEAIIRLIVPTDQLGKIAAALVQPQQPSIVDRVTGFDDSVTLQ